MTDESFKVFVIEGRELERHLNGHALCCDVAPTDERGVQQPRLRSTARRFYVRPHGATLVVCAQLPVVSYPSSRLVAADLYRVVWRLP